VSAVIDRSAGNVGFLRGRNIKVALALAVVLILALDYHALRRPALHRTELAGAAEAADGTPGSAGGFENLGRLRLPSVEEVAAPAVEGAAPPLPEPAAEPVVVPPPDAFAAEAPPPPAAPPPPLRHGFDGVQPSSGTWAVVVGVNDYPGGRYDLRSAVADANDVNEALSRLGVASSRRLLLRDGQATAGAIRSALEWLVANAGPDAVAAFFYAGHVRKVGSGTEELVGADGRTITDADLAGQLSRLEARRAWIAIAACYSGGFTEVMRPGRVLTAAAPADQVAYENPNFGRSYLVEYMVRRAIIQDQASATVQTAFNYAREHIKKDYPNRVPVQFDSAGGPLDLRPPGSSGPPPQPSSSGGSAGSGSGSAGGGSSSTPPKEDQCGLFALLGCTSSSS
jgi:hypothetical protein